MRLCLCLFIASVVLITNTSHAQEDNSLRWWLPEDRAAQKELEAALNAVPTPASLRAYHELFASEPHLAGTPGDLRNIERLIDSFEELGLEVQVHEFWAYLAYPVEATVEIIGAGVDGGNLALPVHEKLLDEDPFDDHEDLLMGWNAYSGSGDVTAEVVYVNYGTIQDFKIISELGIDLTGRIALARYGGNFRGYKAKFAEKAGAIGLIIYTDPKDAGFSKGEVYPEGGWANESYIQRGSIKALDYQGDPLTPFEPATKNARRLSTDDIALPHIPVQPIGYGAAKQILLRMRGTPLSEDLAASWQGGFDFDYHLTGGSGLRVRLMVKQTRRIARSANVLATLPGAIFPDEKIYIGCHHDAWGYGAGDPLSGTMLVYEAAKSFAAAAKRGFRPARTIVFANWGAEEYGIIGSTEYVEQFRKELMSEVVAYINLDAATMGPNFHSSASPSLKQVIEDVTHLVPQAKSDDETPIFAKWLGDNDEPNFGNLGGGSDHVGFYCHLGIPSCSLGAGGAPGTAYHSNYDNIAWYQKVVGEDYEPALMLTRVVNLLAARLANATILPLNPVRYAVDGVAHLEALEKRAQELDFVVDLTSLRLPMEDCRQRANEVNEYLLDAIQRNALEASHIARINAALHAMEKTWMIQQGLPDRPWYRNLYAATDPNSGYAAWMLPALRRAIENRDADDLRTQITTYLEALKNLQSTLVDIEKAILRASE
ncbi:MAG: M28 family peptidase [Planctomycetes bacterium]|nr:M28 family peptidase [Planctomycetota bacterium]